MFDPKVTDSKTTVCKIFNMYYSSDNLPLNGWIQSCIYCEYFTANLSFYKSVKNKKKQHIDINCYLCKQCLRNINKHADDKEKYHKICKEMFNENEGLIMKCT